MSRRVRVGGSSVSLPRVKRTRYQLSEWAGSTQGMRRINRKRLAKLLRHTLPGGRLERFHPGNVTVWRGGNLGRHVRGFSKKMEVAWGFSDMDPSTRDFWQVRVTRRTPALDLVAFAREHPVDLLPAEEEVLVGGMNRVRIHGRVRGKLPNKIVREYGSYDYPDVISVRSHLRLGRAVRQHMRHIRHASPSRIGPSFGKLRTPGASLGPTARTLLKNFRTQRRVIGVRSARAFIRRRVADWRRL